MCLAKVFSLTQILQENVLCAYKQFLGYRKGEDGQPEIVPEEAETVRRIYRLFLEGKTPYMIAKILTNDGVLSPARKKVWQYATIRSILTNEKYKGDAILQKTFCTDFLTKKKKRNEGELPQYYVKESHPAIVTAEEFDMVQHEMSLRLQEGFYSGVSSFSGRIVCGCCGSRFGSKVWHSNNKYRRTVWQCNAKYRNAQMCDAPHLSEKTIQEAFLKAVNRIIPDRRFIVEDAEVIIATLTNTEALDREMVALKSELAVVGGLIEKMIADNAHTVQDQAEYQSRHSELSDRYAKAEARLNEVSSELKQRQAKGKAIRAFMTQYLALEAPVTVFNDTLWAALVDRVTVVVDGSLTFLFRNGTSVYIPG